MDQVEALGRTFAPQVNPLAEWPRLLKEIDCPNCDKPVEVMQTSYGARATCRPCLIRWTTLFSEKGTWTDETYSPITDTTTRGRSDKDRATSQDQRSSDSPTPGGDGR